MLGAGLTAVVWLIAVGVTRTAGFGSSLRSMSRGLGREHLALVFLLLTFHAGAELGGGGSGLIQDAIRGGFAFLALVVIGPRFVAQMRVNRIYRRRMWGMAALLVYISVGILSVAYTVDLVSTLGKVFEMTVALMLVFVLAFREDAADAIRRTISFVLFLEGALVLTAVIGFFTAPSLFAVRLSRPGFVFAATMDAPYSGPNGFSVMGAILTGWGVARAFETPKGGRLAPWFAVSSLGIVATILSSGRQGLIILMVSVAALFFIYRRVFTVLVGAPVALAVAATQWSTLWDIVLREQNEGSVATLTGRTTFWAAGWDALQQQPLTGHGLGISADRRVTPHRQGAVHPPPQRLPGGPRRCRHPGLHPSDGRRGSHGDLERAQPCSQGRRPVCDARVPADPPERDRHGLRRMVQHQLHDVPARRGVVGRDLAVEPPGQAGPGCDAVARRCSVLRPGRRRAMPRERPRGSSAPPTPARARAPAASTSACVSPRSAWAHAGTSPGGWSQPSPSGEIISVIDPRSDARIGRPADIASRRVIGMPSYHSDGKTSARLCSI